jgi:hypothetical protein
MSAWSKRISRYCVMALAAPMVLALPAVAQDQQQAPPQAQPQPAQQPLSQQQLQQLVAPIALYPDALLAQVLTASTYPLEVTLADEKLDWTAQLGEAFLAQPNDVQTAIQALRKQADATGNLKSSKEQKVSRVPAPQGTGYAGPPEYYVIEPLLRPRLLGAGLYAVLLATELVGGGSRDCFRRGGFRRAGALVQLQVGASRLRRDPDQSRPL